MSVWKKAGKLNQKVHRERHQPANRKHLGLLEKHKDYKQRSSDYNAKRETLRLLHKRAINKNSDEFYYHMINSDIDNDVHREKGKAQYTTEQLKLMQTQDLKYIDFKRRQETRKIEKIQSQLHLANTNCKIKNNHMRFLKNANNKYVHDDIEEGCIDQLTNSNLVDVNLKILAEATKSRREKYMELAKRIRREKELAIIQQKLQTKKDLDSRKRIIKPKQVKRETQNAPPIYKWKYERQH